MSDHEIIEGGYFRDLLDQPRALAASLDGLEPVRLPARDFRRIVLTGMGSSLFALYPLYLELLAHGRQAVHIETGELIHLLPQILDAETLLVAVSQSGQSAEIVRLMETRQPGCFTLGVTNTIDSPLAAGSDALIATRAGTESTVSCKTYVATLMALRWAQAVLLEGDFEAARDELTQVAPAAAAYLEGWQSHVRTARAVLTGVRHLFYLGRGASLAAAWNAGLTTKESAHFNAEGMSSAAFRHGPLEMLSPELFALIFAGDERVASLNCGLAESIRRAGAKARVVSESAGTEAFRLPAVPCGVRPIVEILPVQMVTLALAAIAGREAGRFERASKITATE